METKINRLIYICAESEDTGGKTHIAKLIKKYSQNNYILEELGKPLKDYVAAIGGQKVGLTKGEDKAKPFPNMQGFTYRDMLLHLAPPTDRNSILAVALGNRLRKVKDDDEEYVLPNVIVSDARWFEQFHTLLDMSNEVIVIKKKSKTKTYSKFWVPDDSTCDYLIDEWDSDFELEQSLSRTIITRNI